MKKEEKSTNQYEKERKNNKSIWKTKKKTNQYEEQIKNKTIWKSKEKKQQKNMKKKEKQQQNIDLLSLVTLSHLTLHM